MSEATQDIERLFRLAMRRFPGTVTVVTTTLDGADCGMTATAVTSLSMDPPSLLVCVNRGTGFHSAIEQCDRFCVNVLREGQEDIASIFGGGKPPHERFGDGVWAHEDGIAYLKDAQANIFCRRAGLFQYGTHTIVVGEATALLLHDELAPLIYVDGRYAAVAPNAG